ncbi:MAG TPA: hypothetical protein VF742_13340, partial [Terracidiphilus sp.]
MTLKHIAQASILGRLWHSLMVAALLSGGCTLLAQGTASASHDSFPAKAINRQLCSVTADCANHDPASEVGSAPISIGGFTLSPQNASTLVLDD